MKLLFALLAIATSAMAQDITVYQAPRWLTASQAALAASATADIVSSLGVSYETVPRWRRADGRMATGRSVAVKSGIVAGAVLVQRWAVRRWPDERWIARLSIVTNTAVAAYWGGVAVSNWRLQ